MAVVKRDFVNERPLDALFRSEGAHPLSAVRGPYDFDSRLVDPGIDCQEVVLPDGEVIATPSITRQADMEDCDINVMMARYQATGELPRSNPRSPQWGDFASVPDYQQALNLVAQAQADFDLLPAEVRERFANNSAGMLEFLSREENRDEAIRLGMVERPADPEPPMRVEVVNPSSSGGEAGS